MDRNMVKRLFHIPSAIQFGSADVSGAKMLQTPFHFPWKTKHSRWNFRCIPESQERNELAAKNHRLPLYPTFSAIADSLELIPTLSEVGRQPEIAMAAYKPEVVKLRNCMRYQRDFNGY